MSLHAFGLVPPYQDISHFRAPYKNAIFAGFGALAMHQTAPPTAGPIHMYVYGSRGGAWSYTTSSDPTRKQIPSRLRDAFMAVEEIAKQMSRAAKQDVIVYQMNPQGIGSVIYVAHAHGVLSHLRGFGQPTHHHHKQKRPKHHQKHQPHKKPPHKSSHGGGQGQQGQGPQSPGSGQGSQPITMVFYQTHDGATWYTTSVDPEPIRLAIHGHTKALDLIKDTADQMAESTGEDVSVHRSGGANSPVGPQVYEAHAESLSGFYGFGDDPAACVAPKWTYSEITGNCACAPGYIPTPDGTDCVPLVDPNAPYVPPTGGMSTWGFTNQTTGAAAPDDGSGGGAQAPSAGAPVAPASPAAPGACAGYQFGSTCVPKWALWVGGGLAALLVVDLVL